MYTTLKSDDIVLQKPTAHADQPIQGAGEKDAPRSNALANQALPSNGQGQLVMQCKGLSNQAEPQPAQGPLIQRKAHGNGLPDKLKNGIEQLSGYPMDDVTVHYNSHKPAQQQAHAYTQGKAIHVAPGQEQHLPHEAWHAVQQKQGRVKPTLQMKGKAGVNDDAGLEREADVMGAKALQTASSPGHRPVAEGGALQTPRHTAASNQGTIQKIDLLWPFRRRPRQQPQPLSMFQAVIDNPRAVKYFRWYLDERQNAKENLDFVMALRQLYPDIGPVSYKVYKYLNFVSANKIYTRFIREGALDEVNISAVQRNEINNALNSNNAIRIRTAYESAYDEVLDLLENIFNLNFVNDDIGFYEAAEEAVL
jgi:hypothetical protein